MIIAAVRKTGMRKLLYLSDDMAEHRRTYNHGNTINFCVHGD